MKNYFAIWVVIGLALGGCSEQVLTFYNQSLANEAYRSFMVTAPEEDNEMPPQAALLDKQLRAIITTDLLNKGFAESALPDLYVSYFVSTQATTETTSSRANPYGYPYSYGYGYPYSPYDYNTTTREYKTGVLVIEIKNAAGKLVWQGSKAFKVRSKETLAAVLPAVCKEIMAACTLQPGGGQKN